ncbi:DUF6338 family protein [Paenibacillus kandeliae]|uniref:DUF6338 family protein n=1 Tax=Paenibacillus kandeliae TaxID=3231269 RepID=UPI00345A3C93
MIPTAAQLITIIILLVPGFLSMQVASKFSPTKKLSTFDSTVLSIIFSLIIHMIYTLAFIYLNMNWFNRLLLFFKTSIWSSSLTIFMLIYLIGLIISSVLSGYILATFKNNGRLYKLIKRIGFDYYHHENLWDEMINIYSLEKQTPLVIINYEDNSYAGWIYRASFDLEKNERKEIILAQARYKNREDTNWTALMSDLVYLNLAEAKSIEYVNGSKILKSKY